MKAALLLAALTASAQAGRLYAVQYVVVADESVDKDFDANQADADKKMGIFQTLCKGTIAEGDFECDLGKGQVVEAVIGSVSDECTDVYTVDGDEDGKYTAKLYEDYSQQFSCENNFVVRKTYEKSGCAGDAMVGSVKFDECQYDDDEAENYCGYPSAYTSISYVPHDFDCTEAVTDDDKVFLGYFAGSVSLGIACYHDGEEGLFTKDASKAFFFGFDGKYTSYREYYDAACKDDQVDFVYWGQSTECTPMRATCGPNSFLDAFGIEQGYGADSLGNTWMKGKAVYTNSYKNGSLWCTARYSDDKCETVVDDVNIFIEPSLSSPTTPQPLEYGDDRAVDCESLFAGSMSYGKCIPIGYDAYSSKQDAFLFSKLVSSPASVIAPAVAILAPVFAALM